jgi:glycosyltransferase involved in cell wall biosynthesis
MLKVHRARHTWDESVSGYLALTEFARRKFIRSGLPGHKVHVKPNFVFPDPGERTSPGDYAIFAGRLSEEKGVSTLLAAWKHVSQTIPLVIVGDGPLRKKLEQEVAARGLRDVSFRGWLSLGDTRAAIQQARFLIIPSVWYEAFSLNIVESFACGTPVLCSRLGAMEENVAEHRTGLHFTAGDPADLAEKVDWAWSHPAELAAMGREARREYETRYTAEQNYSLLMNIYQHTVATHA